jgi:ATP-dependent Lon protease
MEKTQKNYYLNEQMRAIKKEMGAEDEASDELKDLESRRSSANACPKRPPPRSRQEFKKLKMMTPMSAEATVVRNYIDWMISLPWFNRSRIRNDHRGRKDSQRRSLRAGKTQGAHSRVPGRPNPGEKTARPHSLPGGPPRRRQDVPGQIRRPGHRAKICSPVPGRCAGRGRNPRPSPNLHRRHAGKIIQSLKKAGANNPVFCLDEVDKMSMDFRGDPHPPCWRCWTRSRITASTTTTWTWITTCPIFCSSPRPTPAGHPAAPAGPHGDHPAAPATRKLKNTILPRRSWFPSRSKPMGSKPETISFSKAAIYTIIQRYTREAGVRNLEREIHPSAARPHVRSSREG